VWTLTDHQGTVKDYLAKAPTAGAESGLLLTRQYSTFGTPLSAKQWVNVPTGGTSFTDINGKSGFFYVGQEYDASTGLQYSRARYYDPVSSEFISQDPLGFAGGDTNLYRRDGNQSVSARPRDRNWAEWAWESGAAAASTIGNALKLAVDPRSQLSAGYDLFFKDTATVWGNTAGMSTASRLGITAGFFVGDLTGLRGVDDFFHTHDAADAHVQSRTEQWFDGVFGAIGVAGTIAGGGAVAKTVQTLGVKGTVAAGAAYARATVERAGTGARGLVDDVVRAGKNAVAPVSGLEGAIGFAPGYAQGIANKGLRKSFRKAMESVGAKVKFVTEGDSYFNPRTMIAMINKTTATPGTLLDEFSHAFSRMHGKGRYLSDELAEVHKALANRAKVLGSTDRLGLSDNTLYHQLELLNFLNSGVKTPGFIRAIPQKEIARFLGSLEMNGPIGGLAR
jgi:RHS repeat-associated protein